MCEFSHEGSKLVQLKKSDALVGYRFWKLAFGEQTLKSLNQNFLYNRATVKSPKKPEIGDSLGFYNYNYNYNYNNYNNYNYYNNNNYNYYNYYNYNYYNNYNYHNYNYNYYYNYYIIMGTTILYGQTVTHRDGNRSERMQIKAFFSLKDHENKKFLTHFNERIEKVAKKLKVRVIPFQYGDALPIIK